MALKVRDIEGFIQWCSNNFLEVNVSKTKEPVIDFDKNGFTVPPLQISGELVELVSTYKYLEAQTNWQIGFPRTCAEQVKPIQMRQQHYTNALQIFPAEHSVLRLHRHCRKQACSRSGRSTAHDHDSQSKSLELTRCLSLSCTPSLFFLKEDRSGPQGLCSSCTKDFQES